MHKFGYHFSVDGRLAHKDGRKIAVGTTHRAMDTDGRKKTFAHAVFGTCSTGLHASPRPHQAWEYVRGHVVSRVLVHGINREYYDVDDDKFAGLYRTYLAVHRLTDEEHDKLALLYDRGQPDEFDALCRRLLKA